MGITYTPIDFDRIEQRARHLQRTIFKERVPEVDSLSALIDLLEPEVWASTLGVSLIPSDNLGSFGSRGDRYQVAGVLNRRTRTVSVLRTLPIETQRFTASHELGHLDLNDVPGQDVFHRDRPIDGQAPDARLPPHERRANHFGACWLMPRKLVISQFILTFGPPPFVLDDDSAQLFFSSDQVVLRRSPGLSKPAYEIAKAESFASINPFASMASRFRVSAGAMARRLLELNLLLDRRAFR